MSDAGTGTLQVSRDDLVRWMVDPVGGTGTTAPSAPTPGNAFDWAREGRVFTTAVFMPHIASSSVQQIHAQMHACTHTHSHMHARADGLAPRNACAAASAQSHYSSPIPKPQPPNPQVLKQLVPCTERILAVVSDLRDWQLGASMQYPCRHFHFAPLRSHQCRFTTLPVPLDTRQYRCRQYHNPVAARKA